MCFYLTISGQNESQIHGLVQPSDAAAVLHQPPGPVLHVRRQRAVLRLALLASLLVRISVLRHHHVRHHPVSRCHRQTRHRPHPG